jgi:hypothetical protein
MPVAVTVAAADVRNRRRSMLNGKFFPAMMPSCEKKGWRYPLPLPSMRPHPRFRETTVLRKPVGEGASLRLNAGEIWGGT